MIKISHGNFGFFSCSSVRLINIIQYTNKSGSLPTSIDCSELYKIYKTENRDMTFDFFENYDTVYEDFQNLKDKFDMYDYQFTDYKTVEYNLILPYVRKYFSPTKTIINISNDFISKYNINPENCIAVYYRGTDKWRETEIDSIENYYNKINELINKPGNENMQLLLKSDSAEFID